MNARGVPAMVARAVLVAVAAVALIAGARAAPPSAAPSSASARSPDDVPSWFAPSFLDFRDELADATRAGKRILIYVGQEGCPYCRRLIAVNFAQHAIVDSMQAHFVPIALDLWGDRAATWIDGNTLPEKALATRLGVRFTPTILILDEHGAVVVRMDGYWPPPDFLAALDYAAGHRERDGSLGDWLRANVHEKASPVLHDEPFFLAPPYDLSRRAGGKPLAVVFETIDCPPCDELHREAFRRQDVAAQLARFDVVRLEPYAATPLVTPGGQRTTARAWARELGIAWAPSVVFFDAQGREVFRIDAYLRPFHLASSFAYVADGAYVTQPSFQRWLRERADAMRRRGDPVDIWN